MRNRIAALRIVDTPDDGSATLLDRAQAGDASAVDQLIGRYLPRLRRWAHGRVPSWARDGSDTEDLVQETVIAVLRNLHDFEYRHEGALQAYLRQAVLNRVRAQFRRGVQRPAPVALNEAHPDDSPSPLEHVIGTQLLDAYEHALMQLADEERELIIAKLEMGYTNDELAALFGKPSKDAARVAAARALLQLARLMSRD